MRYLILIALLSVTACDMPRQHGPVDPTTLPPLSSREHTLLIAADGALKTGAFAQAERNYLDAIALSKGHIDAHRALAQQYLAGQDHTRAAEVLEEAVQWQPNQPEVNYMLGKAYLQLGRTDDGLTAFLRGLKASPKDANLLSGAAIAYDSKAQHKRAQELHRQSMNVTAKNDRAAFTSNLAMSYLLDNQPKQTISLLEPEWKKPIPMPQVLRHNLALAYGMLNRNWEARKVLNGEISEEARVANVAQLRAYIAAAEAGKANAVKAAIHTPAALTKNP